MTRDSQGEHASEGLSANTSRARSSDDAKSSGDDPRDHELGYLGAAEQARLYRAKQLSPVEVTQAALRRIERAQPTLNAFVLVDAEAALESARAAERRFQRGEPSSALDGVTVSLKDLLLTRGWATRQGSKATDPAGPWSEDSPAAARLREAGAVLLGKTTTSEFGLRGMGDCPLTGITRNPWHPDHSPGGSSAGAVTAVAAGLGTLAVGTDGGGSIRVPSAFTGVVGLKPSYGRVPTYPAGVIGAPPHVGPITRSVQDATLLLEVLSRPDDRDPYRLPPPRTREFDPSAVSLPRIRVGYLASAKARCAPDVGAAFERALADCRTLGLEPVPVELELVSAGEVLKTLFVARAAHTLRQLPAETRPLVGSAIQAAAAEGERQSSLDYLAAEAERTRIALRVAEVFRSVDLLLTPTTAAPAPKTDAQPAPERTPFTAIFSLTRQPAISIPSGTTRDGLPIGLQVVGRHFEEGLVLALAAALESRRPFAPPPAAFRR